MNEPTQTQGSAAVPANGVPAGTPIAPTTETTATPVAAPPGSATTAEQQQVSQQNPGITLDEVDAIIAKRKHKREAEQQQQQKTQAQVDYEAKYKEAQEHLEAYRKAAIEIRQKPLQSLRKLGFEDDHFQEMLTNLQVEGQPSHQAMTKVAELEAKLAAQEAKHQEFVNSLQQKEQRAMSEAEVAYARQEMGNVGAVAVQVLGKDSFAEQYWSQQPEKEVWGAIREFYDAYCERNNTKTCPYPEIVRYLDQRARRDAAPIVERLAPALGWVKPEAPTATSPASKDAPQTASPKTEKKKKVDVSKLSREERVALAEAELQRVREERGQKG